MNKARVVAAAGALVGFWAALYAAAGLVLFASAAPAEVRTLHFAFWTLLLVVSAGVCVASVVSLAVSRARRRKRAAVDHLASLREFHERELRPVYGLARGCAPADVDDLERFFGFEMPFAYRQFLEFMGADYSGPLGDARCFIDNVVENTQLLRDAVPANVELPPRFVAFYLTDDGAAWFALPKEAENPRVFAWDGTLSEHAAFAGFIAAKLKAAGGGAAPNS